MDLNLIKQKLDHSNKQSTIQKRDIHYFGRPSVGKQQIRIVPNNTKNIPFTEMYILLWYWTQE